MATNVYHHTEPTSWITAMASQSEVFDGTSGLSDPGDYVHSKTIWAENMAADPELKKVMVAEGSSIAWRFYSKDGNNKATHARLWGLTKLVDLEEPANEEWLADYLCKLQLTTGANGVTSAGNSDILPVCNFVDTIVIDEDRSLVPGLRVISHGDDTFAAVVLDGLGYAGYILQMAEEYENATWGAMYRVF